MSVQPIDSNFHDREFDLFPSLTLIQGGDSESVANSRDDYEDYHRLREECINLEKTSGRELDEVQHDVRGWIESTGLLEFPDDQESIIAKYKTFDREHIDRKLGGLIGYLRTYHADKVSELELEATEKFISSSFAMYEDVATRSSEEPIEDADGSFAFIVPTRMSRKNKEYGGEAEPIIPALRYVPNELRSQMIVGIPPLVIDRYGVDDNGRRGILVLAPVYEDIKDDIEGLSSQINVAVSNVNEAVDFAHKRFGVSVVGLGATLPALTMYGKKIANKDVVVTTGHGGTTELIFQTIDKGVEQQQTEVESIGVLGLGAIGASVAEVIAERYPDAKLRIYDKAEGRARKVKATNPERYEISGSDAELVEESHIVVSAITGQFNLQGSKTLEGKIIVDDAQPGSFDPKAVQELGGNVLWVVGRDTVGETAQRTNYNYASMVDAKTDVFGCEAEAASISRYKDELIERVGERIASRVIDRVAINHAVDVQSVRYISALFKKYGITASEPQAFGRPVEL